jgi:hypothetical protein
MPPGDLPNRIHAHFLTPLKFYKAFTQYFLAMTSAKVYCSNRGQHGGPQRNIICCLPVLLEALEVHEKSFTVYTHNYQTRAGILDGCGAHENFPLLAQLA